MASLSSSNTSQSYFLRFSSHSAALSRSLLALLSESYCTDVHISTGHQSQTIRAHKIILSAFSPYFKSLFSSLPTNQFPVIIIREISYDILRTIIEFCYRGEILVSRDKLDDIVSAAKFLQIEGAKDFILPKHSQQPPNQTSQQHNNTGVGSVNANNRMQIDLQQQMQSFNTKQSNNHQKQSLIAQQQHQQSAQQHKTMSLLSKLVQKPMRPIGAQLAEQQQTTDNSMPIISGVRHINEKELIGDNAHRVIKQEVLDEEEEEVIEEEEIIEEEEEVDESIEEVDEMGGGGDGHKSSEKSGMFAEFEDQNIIGNNNTKSCNNESSNRNSEESGEDEAMDTSAAAMGHILAKVPPGTSVSTTLVSTDTTVGQKNDNLNVPIHESDDELGEDLEEEEEYEDEFDEEEECDSTNPLDVCNVNYEDADESHPLAASVDTSLHMSSATARAIAASTLASFNTIDIDSECSTSQSSQSAANQYGSPQSVTITAIGGSHNERRGRGRPPKYELGNVFGPQPSPSSSPIIIGAPTQQPPEQTASTSSSPQSLMATTSSASSSATRSRRGRPPSMPEELLRSLTGRLDKAHHKCPHCPQIYYGYHAMRDHITSVHLNSGEKYICNLCNKEYTWRITLRKHLKFHHGVHPDQVQNA